MDQLTIYVLFLSNNNYYIGKTNKPIADRFTEHLNGSVAWTTLHKPLNIIELINTTNPIDEDSITKKYMCIYGIEHVRGGSYTKIILDDWMLKALEHEFISIKNKCYKCKKEGHFAKNCDSAMKQKMLEYYNLLMSTNPDNSTEYNLIIIDNEINRLHHLIHKITKLNQVIQLTNSITIEINREDTRSIVKKTFEINHSLLPIVDKFEIINGQYKDRDGLNSRDRHRRELTSFEIEQYYAHMERDHIYYQLNKIKQEILSIGVNRFSRTMLEDGDFTSKIINDFSITFINTDNYKIITLQIMNFNKDKQSELDEIIKNEESINMIESKIEFLLNKRFNI